MYIKLTRNGVDSAPTAPLTDGVGSVLDWEVYFPLAGCAGPGFHTWPGSADVLVGEYETASPHPVPWQKDVRRGGDAATVAGVAGPGFHNWPSGHIPQDTAPKPLFRIRSPGKKTFGEVFGAATGVSDPRLQKTRIRNNGAGGDAATVAGVAGPGFHNWPSGHIPQDTAPKPLFRIRSSAKKTFGETFGAATGVSDPRLQKTRIRNNGAGGDAATVAGVAGPGFHPWPSGHIPQDTAPKPLLRIRLPAKRRSERRSARRAAAVVTYRVEMSSL